MTQMNTDYTPAGITTTTSAPPSGPGFGVDSHLADIANQIMQMKLDAARRKEAADAEAAQLSHMDEMNRRRLAAADAVGGRVTTTPTYHAGGSVALAGSSSGGMGGTVQQQMQQLALRDASNQVRTKESSAPLRMVQGPGIVPGYTQDVDAMSPYQREAFLPQGSTLTRLQ